MNNLLTTHKDASAKPTGGIYQIDCSCGHSYIGQTGRDFKIRIKEHKRHLENSNLESAVTDHVLSGIMDKTPHTINWDNFKILDIEPRLQPRKVKESIYIRTTAKKQPLMNRKDELGSQWLHNYWNVLLNELYST